MKEPMAKIVKTGITFILILSMLGLSGCKSNANDSITSNSITKDMLTKDTPTKDTSTKDTSTKDTLTNEVSVGESNSPTCSPELDISSGWHADEQSNQGAAVTENTKYADKTENKIENLYGTWYINSTDATLWINELRNDYNDSRNDYTIENFNLDTMQYESCKNNYSYVVNDDNITFDTFNGGSSYIYQCYDDDSVILTSVDTGETITLTREMGLSGHTVTETIDGHKYGHRIGNVGWGTNHISFGSVLAWEGGVVYYVDVADNHHLYCCNEDGSNRQMMLGMHVADVNIMDGWVYFTAYDEDDLVGTTGVYRMKLDGTELSKLFVSQSPNELSVVDDRLYYIILTSNGSSLYQSDLDGNNARMIANLESYGDFQIPFNIYGDYAYFAHANITGVTIDYYTLMRISLLDGTIDTIVPVMSSRNYFIDNDGIFVIRNHDIYTYDLNGANEVKLVDCKTDYVIKKGHNLIYYSGTNTRGTEMVSITDLQNPTTILNFAGKLCYTDKYLYYYKNNEIQVTECLTLHD